MEKIGIICWIIFQMVDVYEYWNFVKKFFFSYLQYLSIILLISFLTEKYENDPLN